LIRYYTYEGETGMIFWGHVNEVDRRGEKVPIVAPLPEDVSLDSILERLKKPGKEQEPVLEPVLQPVNFRAPSATDWVVLVALVLWAVLSPDPFGEVAAGVKFASMYEVDSAAPYWISPAVSAKPPLEPDLHLSAYPAPHQSP